MSDNGRSESVEMYLKTIAELSAGEEPVAIARIAERLGVTQVSANEMVKRLAGADLVVHTLYKGVTLTTSGSRVANAVIRRERLWERFLYDHLHLDWTRVHAWACQLEHATAHEVAEALDAFLGYPDTCPQGRPIPRTAQPANAQRGLPLNTLPVGQTARILAVQEESAKVLEYLQKRHLLPGQMLTVAEAAPLEGPLTLQLGDDEVILGLNLAATILVEPLP